MNPQVRYQVFVSSTYEDLREERQQATQAILEVGSFPSGMELFPASDDTQWELIKRVIEECDYYVVIVGGRYGSIAPEGYSYTEMEYDYAVSKGIPVLGFVRQDIEDIPAKFSENTEAARKKLQAFRRKVMSRNCRRYSSPAELGMHVMKSIIHEARVRPRTGWARADQARSEADRQREQKLINELEEALEEIEVLKRENRDRSVLAEELPREQLAQGDDCFEFTVLFRDDTRKCISQSVLVSWDDIFRTIGPSMYGYILAKGSRYNETPKYSFQQDLERYLRSRIYHRVQRRKFEIAQGQVDTCIIQLKELGLLMFQEKHQDDGKVFRGVTLTEFGEKHLARPKTERR